jgi:hypothetical protein
MLFFNSLTFCSGHPAPYSDEFLLIFTKTHRGGGIEFDRSFVAFRHGGLRDLS